MSLRYALLGMLSERPMSGYDLTRGFDVSLANVWSARHSQIYPELARLVEEGLIEQVEDGPRGRKVYAATAEGREAVIGWLRSGEPSRAIRDESLLRGFFAWMLPADEAAAMFDREAEARAEQLAGYERLANSDFWDRSDAARVQRLMLESGIRWSTAMVEWAVWAAESCRGGAIKGSPAPAGSGRSRSDG